LKILVGIAVKTNMQKIQGVTYNSASGEPTFWQGQAIVSQDGASTKIDGWGHSVFRARKVEFVLCGDLHNGSGTLLKMHLANEINYQVQTGVDGRLVLFSPVAKGCVWVC
jgi:hypothetical protein